MQKCLDAAACGVAIGDCGDGYETDSDVCIGGLSSEVIAAIAQCGEDRPADGSQPQPDGGAIDDLAGGNDGGAAADDTGASDAGAADSAACD